MREKSRIWWECDSKAHSVIEERLWECDSETSQWERIDGESVREKTSQWERPRWWECTPRPARATSTLWEESSGETARWGTVHTLFYHSSTHTSSLREQPLKRMWDFICSLSPLIRCVFVANTWALASSPPVPDSMTPSCGLLAWWPPILRSPMQQPDYSHKIESKCRLTMQPQNIQTLLLVPFLLSVCP